MFDPALTRQIASERHGDYVRAARRHPLSAVAPRERRQTLGRLGRAFQRALDDPATPRTFLIARSGSRS